MTLYKTLFESVWHGVLVCLAESIRYLVKTVSLADATALRIVAAGLSSAYRACWGLLGWTARPVCVSVSALVHVKHAGCTHSQPCGAAAAVGCAARLPCLCFWPVGHCWQHREVCRACAWPAAHGCVCDCVLCMRCMLAHRAVRAALFQVGLCSCLPSCCKHMVCLGRHSVVSPAHEFMSFTTQGSCQHSKRGCRSGDQQDVHASAAAAPATQCASSSSGRWTRACLTVLCA